MARPKIVVPGPGADRPNAAKIGLAAALPFLVGVLLVQASLEAGPAVTSTGGEGGEAPERTPAAQPVAETEGDPDPEPDPVAEGEAEPELESDTEPTPDAHPEGEVEPAPDPEPEVAIAPRRVGLGRVAYLKCDGAPPVRGPFPCPRDRDLEAAVWAALETLPECPQMPTEVGPADLRLVFVPDAPVEIGTRSRGPESLPDDALLACLAGPLEGISTSIAADDLLVSFHFALISADR